MKCETFTCERDAVLACHWPGRSLGMCQLCASRAIRTAEHMGFALTVASLPRVLRELVECDKCKLWAARGADAVSWGWRVEHAACCAVELERRERAAKSS